ncbi:hypothetical protein niasHT_034949 [Heterodera trifolii]|uniref:Uncharacterized protein n=1 Tax=Heterodera trifolii TaxID=157864 RepID=A0ABD2I3K2_9BILA
MCAIHHQCPSSPAHNCHYHTLAAIYEHPAILRALLDHDGSHIDARDSEGRTALHYAAALAGTLREDDAD